MKTAIISPQTLLFLRELSAHNYREWFQKHKGRYELAQRNMIEFAEALIDRMSEHDNIVPMTGKKSLFRIYRDVRFSKDKSPYKKSISGQMKRDTKWLRGGYYYHIEPNNSFLGGGFWGPNKEDLKRIRDGIADDDQPLREIIADPTFQKTFGELKGNGVKTAPKGFSKDHPAIDLIRKKQFIVSRSFTDEQVTSTNFLDEVVETFCAMRPFFDYMSDVLTTDANGERIE